MYEPERVQKLTPEKLVDMFHADSALFVKVKEWDTKYKLLKTTTVVATEYSLYKKDGALLFKGNGREERDSSEGFSISPVELAIDAISVALSRAKLNYVFTSFLANEKATSQWGLGAPQN